MKSKREILSDLIKEHIYSLIPSYVLKVFKKTPWIINSVSIHQFILVGFFEDDFNFVNPYEYTEKYPSIPGKTTMFYSATFSKKDMDPTLARKIETILNDIRWERSGGFQRIESLSLIKKKLTKEEEAKAILEDLRNKVDSVL